MLTFFKRITKLTIITLTLGFLFALSTLWYFSTDLPDYKILANYKPPISSRVHSGEGQLIAEYALQKRLFIPYDSVPSNVINSFLSAEDKNFFSHPGVDAKSITRAVIKNLKNIFSRYEIYIDKIFNYEYVNNFRNSNFDNIFDLADKLGNGLNQNEIIFIKKPQEKRGFFEKFFNFFR